MRTQFSKSRTPLTVDDLLYLVRGKHPKPEGISDARWAAAVRWYEKRQETREPYKFPPPPPKNVDA